MRKQISIHFNKTRISKGFALWGGCCVLFACGCSGNAGDFFSYAPKTHIITQELIEETLADNSGSGSAGQAASGTGTEQTASQPTQTSTPATQPAEIRSSQTQSVEEKTSEEKLVGNVEYIGIGERGIIRDIPFVYKGLQLDYDGDAERDLSLTKVSSGRPVASTVVRNAGVSTAEQGQKGTTAETGEPLLRYGIVSFNKTFYEGELRYHGDFQADITIAYSGAGRLQASNGVPVEIPVASQYSDDDDWHPATVVIQLCGAVGGKNGRTYGVVRNQDGSLDMMQYSYEYTDMSGAKRYVRLIASFYGGASEEQAAALLNRFSFKFVGDKTQ